MPASPVPAAPTRPTPGIRRTLYAVGVAVWLSGVLWWTFDKYMLQRSDFGVSENPLQVWWLRLHAGTATATVWLFGYLSAIHVQRNWKGGVRRNSGLVFVVTLALLTISGYLLYYVEADPSFGDDYPAALGRGAMRAAGVPPASRPATPPRRASTGRPRRSGSRRCDAWDIRPHGDGAPPLVSSTDPSAASLWLPALAALSLAHTVAAEEVVCARRCQRSQRSSVHQLWVAARLR